MSLCEESMTNLDSEPQTEIMMEEKDPLEDPLTLDEPAECSYEDKLSTVSVSATLTKRNYGRKRKSDIESQTLSSSFDIATSSTQKVYEMVNVDHLRNMGLQDQRLKKQKSAPSNFKSLHFGRPMLFAKANITNEVTSAAEENGTMLNEHDLKIEHSPPNGNSDGLNYNQESDDEYGGRVVCNFSFMSASKPIVKQKQKSQEAANKRTVCNFSFFPKKNPVPSSTLVESEESEEHIEIKQEPGESTAMEIVDCFFATDESDLSASPSKKISKPFVKRIVLKKSNKSSLALKKKERKKRAEKTDDLSDFTGLNVKKLLANFHPVTIVIKNPDSNVEKPFFDPANLITVLHDSGLHNYDQYGNIDVVQKPLGSNPPNDSGSINSSGLDVQCPRCSFVGTGSDSLRKHTIQVHFKDPTHPMSAKKSTKCRRLQNYEFLMKIKKEVEVFKCENCPEMFSRKKLLDDHHLYMHSEDRKFVCPVCSKRFTSMKNMSTHKYTVHGPKKYPCSFCEKCFATKREVKKHENGFHLKSVEWKCEHCSKGFSDKRNLEIHVEGFHLQKISTCNECGAKFRFKNSLYKHLQKFH